MMRLNAPIQAFLALAVLSILPAPLLAKPAHHPPAHKTAATDPAPKKRNHKKATAQTASSHKRPSGNQDAPATVQHVRSSTRRKASSAIHSVASTDNAPTPEKETDTATNESAHRKATSADFLRAASAQTTPEQTDAPESNSEAPHVDK